MIMPIYSLMGTDHTYKIIILTKGLAFANYLISILKINQF